MYTMDKHHKEKSIAMNTFTWNDLGNDLVNFSSLTIL